MQQAKSIDLTTLQWLRPEIEIRLKQAHLALELVAQTPVTADQLPLVAKPLQEVTRHLQEVISHLHEVWGALHMIELTDPAQLVEAMESFAQALSSEPGTQTASNFELLMRTLLHVLDILARLGRGDADHARALFPLINELRVAQGQNPEGPGALFEPDLSLGLLTHPIQNQAQSQAQFDVPAIARKLRPLYQLAWVNWHRNMEDQESLHQLLRIMLRLEDISSTGAAAQLWSVTSALVEALIDGGLRDSVPIQLLLGQVDREIKRLIDLGESNWAEHPPTPLVKAILYHVGRARSAGRRVAEITKIYQLRQFLPDQYLPDQQRALESGTRAPERELILAVSTAVWEDLAKVKDGLEILARSNEPAPGQLLSLEAILRTTAGTLEVLGLPEAHASLLRQAGNVAALVRNSAVPDAAQLLAMASTLLQVESALADLGLARPALTPASSARQDRDSGSLQDVQSPLGEAEFQDVLRAVVKEARIDMARIKEAVIAYSGTPMRQFLVNAPGLITQVMGGLAMLSEQRAADLLDVCKRYIVEEVLEEQLVPAQGSLGGLAEVIASIDFYLEALEAGRSERATILDQAQRILISGIIQADAPAPAPERPGNRSSAHVSDDLGGDIHPEIVAIFIEEAEGELANLATHLPMWSLHPESTQSLQQVRRSFHTLKGSGLMAGAQPISALAGAIEQLLDRIMGGTVTLSPDLFDLLGEARGVVLPELIRDFSGDFAAAACTYSGSDVQDLIDRVHQLGNRCGAFPAPLFAAQQQDEVDDADSVHAEAIVRTPQQQFYVFDDESASDTDIPYDAARTSADNWSQGDPVLIDIFTQEASQHLAAMRAFTDCCALEPQNCRITPGLLRSLHTLRGSASMAGMVPVAEVSTSLEAIITRVNMRQTALNSGLATGQPTGQPTGLAPQLAPELLALVERSIDVITDFLAALHEPAAQPLDMRGVLRDLTAFSGQLADASLHQEPAPANAESSVAFAHAGDSDIFAIFMEEAREILDTSDSTLEKWAANPGNPGLLEELYRQLHTLKGGARMAGVTAVGDLSHSLESVISVMQASTLGNPAQLSELIRASHEALLTMLDCASDKVAIIPASALIARLDAISAGLSEDHPAPNLPMHTSADLPKSRAPVPVPPAVQRNPEPHPQTPSVQTVKAQRRAGSVPHEQIRVRADLVDSLVNFAGEISISRSRIEQQMGTFKYNLEEVAQIIERLRGQLRTLEIETEAQITFRSTEVAMRQEEFDPLEFDRFSELQELSRSLLESISDLSNIEGLLTDLTRESEGLLLEQSRASGDLHERLMRVRMVQFAVVAPRLRHIAQQTARQLGKQVELRFVNGEGEMDRAVLDRLVPSLEHMLRNAIDHGIESPRQRAFAAKHDAGDITLTLRRQGSEVVIEIDDDGRGLDLAAIRQRAVAHGLLDDAAKLKDDELMQFILEPGFSTSQAITQISGRGVGLDVVNNEIRQLNGHLHIRSEAGRGTTFSIRLPLTLSISRALLVHVGDELYAIPLTSIERIVQVSQEELVPLYEQEAPLYTDDTGRHWTLMQLSRALGGERASAGVRKKSPLLLARTGDLRVAFEIDAILGSREIVMKSLGPQISAIRGITGGTILGDGRVVLILDISALIRATVGARSVKLKKDSIPVRKTPESSITVLVVDDSVTVRKVTTRLLERHNIQVLTAKDGLDAVEVLQDHIPDIMLLDVEMPRMDGFELAAHMRNEPRLRQIPIIMITSRTGQKHRTRAAELGVNLYMGKPYQESELLENINSLLGAHIVADH